MVAEALNIKNVHAALLLIVVFQSDDKNVLKYKQEHIYCNRISVNFYSKKKP